MNLEDILAVLKQSRNHITQLDIPRQPGLYALYLADEASAFWGGLSRDDAIYAGKAKDGLYKRLVNQHFKSGRTGSSTVRRSLGAILKDDLKLVAIPRGRGNSDRDCTNYCFIPEGEEKLTAWMLENLEVGFCSLPSVDTCERWEKVLIEELKPVLCLVGYDNDMSGEMKELRARCAAEARCERGYKP